MSGPEHAHGAHDAAGHRGKLTVVLCLTSAVMSAAIIGALMMGSLALLAHAGHMFIDPAGLQMALIAASLPLKPPRSSGRGATSAPK